MKHSPFPWKIRKAHGLEPFIESPRANGMPYALEVFGQDYTGYGDEEAREADLKFALVACTYFDELKSVAVKFVNYPSELKIEEVKELLERIHSAST